MKLSGKYQEITGNLQEITGKLLATGPSPVYGVYRGEKPPPHDPLFLRASFTHQNYLNRRKLCSILSKLRLSIWILQHFSRRNFLQRREAPKSYFLIFWNDFVTILGRFWDDFGTILGWFGDDLGMIWGWFGDDLGVIWAKTFWAKT